MREPQLVEAICNQETLLFGVTNASNAPTHVALYVGNGNMIHAANPRSGVIVSNVSYWESHGGGHIVSVRRV